MRKVSQEPALRLATGPEASVDIVPACMSSASFWRVAQLGPQDSWLGHAPFAFWLVDVLRPRTFVELGTHGGFSYFAFCQAVERLQLSTSCYAIDTWKGDAHAGLYGEEVYQQVHKQNDYRYSSFSRLIRSTFEEALTHFGHGTIDLLHIDGSHFYEDVRNDFDTWRSRLSNRSVVLFHDTNVRERGFGVFKLWEELRRSYPHFEFIHSHGLGVLGVGEDLPESVRALFAAARDAEATAQIRNAYSRLGSEVSLQFREERQAAELTERRRDLELHRSQLEQLQEEYEQSRERLAQTKAELELQAQQIARSRADRETLRNELARYRLELDRLLEDQQQSKQQLARRDAERAVLRDELAQARADGDTERIVSAQQRLELDRLLQDQEQNKRQLALRGDEIAALQEELARVLADGDAERTVSAQHRLELDRLRQDERQIRERLARRGDEMMVLRETSRLNLLEIDQLLQNAQESERLLARRDDEMETLRAGLAAAQADGETLRVDLARCQAELATLLKDKAFATHRLAKAAAEVERLAGELAGSLEDGVQLSAELVQAKLHKAQSEKALTREVADNRWVGARRSRLLKEINEIHASTIWRSTELLRAFGNGAPSESRTARLFQFAWFIVSFRFVSALRRMRAKQKSIKLIAKTGLFDPAWYLDANPDVGAAGEEPLFHYVEHGAAEGRDPSPLFDTKRYLEKNPRAAKDEGPPLLHYLRHGRPEGYLSIEPVQRSAEADAAIAEGRCHIAFVEDRPEIVLQLDHPIIRDNAAIEPISRLLTIEGWALARGGIEAIEVLVDDEALGVVQCGLACSGVPAAFQTWQGAAECGFRFQFSGRAFGEGEHAVVLAARSTHGHMLLFSFRITVRKPDQAITGTIKRRMLEVRTIQARLEKYDAPFLNPPHGGSDSIPRTPQEISNAQPDLISESIAGATVSSVEAVKEGEAILLQLDLPIIRNGFAIEPLSQALILQGWALARGGMEAIEVSLDGIPVGSARYGLPRLDVGVAFPTWEDAARAGYSFRFSTRSLLDGEHLVTLRARSKLGDSLVHQFRIITRKDDEADVDVIGRKIPESEQRALAGVLSELSWSPHFDLIVLNRHPLEEAERSRTIQSILTQNWGNWRTTILVCGLNEAEASRETVQRLAPEQAMHFRIIDTKTQAGHDLTIAELGGPHLISFLCMGDELRRDALFKFAVASGVHQGADVFYADEVRRNRERDGRPTPFLKPDYSPILLLSMNYLGRPLVARQSVLSRLHLTIGELMRDGLYDLTLRCVEVSKGVHHVRTLLSSTDHESAAAADADAAALAHAMDRRDIPAEVSPGAAPGTWRVRGTKKILGKVSIIVPSCASSGHIGNCLNSIRAKTAYRNFEIICAENIPDSKAHWKRFVHDNSDKVVAMPKDFNWSLFNNRAADVADGEYLLFLNDDVEIIEPGWLDAMLDDAARPEVGIVGARLLYPNRSVQHAGMLLGADGRGRHAFRHANENDPGYFGFALTRREVIAVTGACMMVRRDVFERLGRFEEAHTVINNDLDLCLRAHKGGLLTIYSPYATLIHHEMASRENVSEDFDRDLFERHWATLFAAGDPYYNPGLSRHREDYQVDDEPAEVKFIGRTAIHHAEVKNILVVKLDHIGDFITGLPAVRRLKATFPAARIVVLAAPASGDLVHLEPAIDELISFEFFHTRSQQGERHLAADDLEQLAALLAPYHFDLAVDFRKHLETRDVLRFTGARVLAGYDAANRFPWLDISLELRTDEALQPKRRHISEDLLDLVAAIAAAYQPERMTVSLLPSPMDASEIPDGIRHLFVRQVVVIHAGAGNANKQWPESHFVALIKLLIERNGVAVLLIGGKDEAELATSIMRRVALPDLVASVAGELALHDLPRLLASAALFIGNDSGPKHIAAAIDLPTIGIHSGVVDPNTWGPMGQRSAAIYRKMTCAPCYLASTDHCPRAMACLQLLEPAQVHEVAEMFLTMPAWVAEASAKTALELSARPN